MYRIFLLNAEVENTSAAGIASLPPERDRGMELAEIAVYTDKRRQTGGGMEGNRRYPGDFDVVRGSRSAPVYMR